MSLKESLRQNPTGVVARAYAFAEKAHRPQKRKSGEPYFNHPLAAAGILYEWHMDDATIAAGLLHDTVEDTGIALDDVRREFGDEIAFLVDGVTKLGRLKYRGVESRAENMRKMILALSQDLRVVFIKLADRLHNMRTLGALPPAKQKRIALETNEIYAPLAYRLGMYTVSGELEDAAFSYLLPKEYEWLVATTKEQYAERLAYLEGIKPEVEALLRRHDLKDFAINFRAKRYASLYRKLLRHNMDIGKIYDLVAMRIIVDTIPECYAVLGVIHEAWPPVPGRIKDYIALPKPNAYRSLHTSVIGPGDKIVEFQIRTKSMHEENQYGVAAHWLYKEGGKGYEARAKNADDLAWIRHLRDWQERVFGGNGADADRDPEKFLEAMKVDFFRSRIFAITPRGEVVDLPAGATPIDFAYYIHSDLGNEANGARVNGAIVPLDHELASGDMVEIIRQRGKKPSEDWLKFVKTAAARDHIRAALRGKGFIASARQPTHCLLRIVVEDRVGLIHDISTATAQSHINILSFHTDNPRGSRFPIDRVEVQCTDKSKLARLAVKLKRIKGVREVSYKLV
ncbi:MAG TPA: RelA/SpoT family protein [Candidatus Paceibacterota bacterium]|nr:RelA/SpoT family protein [Candidatus Paceibacterota bacterium]